MSFEKPTTEAELTEYCLRRLGKPVIEINCATDQTAARIQDALQFFNEYHFDGLERYNFTHTVRADDLTNEYIDTTTSVNEVQTITIPAGASGDFVISYNGVTGTGAGITAVSGVTSDYDNHLNLISGFTSGDFSVTGNTADGFAIEFQQNFAGVNASLFGITSWTGVEAAGASVPTVVETTAGVTAIDSGGLNLINVTRMLQLQSGSNSLLSARGQIRGAAFSGLGGSGLFDYDLKQRNLEMSEDMINPEKSIRFSRTTNKIYIEMKWSDDVSLGDKLVFEGYRTIDPDVYSEVYNDMLLKRYCTALIKRQWGMNLKKFGGIQMVGGVELNGQQIFDEGHEEVQKIEEEIQLKWEEPPQFFVG